VYPLTHDGKPIRSRPGIVLSVCSKSKMARVGFYDQKSNVQHWEQNVYFEALHIASPPVDSDHDVAVIDD